MNKAYNKTVGKDGAVTLEFTDARISPKGMGPLLILATLIAVPAGCMGAMTVQMSEYKGIGVILLLITAFLIFWPLFVKRSNKLTIDKDTLAYRSHKFSFAEIDSIGTSTFPTGKYNSAVYVEVGGREVNLTGYMPEALARALRREIEQHSGKTWS